MSQTRPTKKQYELLQFIKSFTTDNGYSPSYREIMSSLGYSSVATVATHVNNLIKRGHLRKRQNHARSLEVVDGRSSDESGQHLQWLTTLIDAKFAADQPDLDQLYVLIGALKVLGFDDQAASYAGRLSQIDKSQYRDDP